MRSRTFLATSNSGTPSCGRNLVPIKLSVKRRIRFTHHSSDCGKIQARLCNSLSKKLSKEGPQHQEKEIKNDQSVQSLSYQVLPALVEKENKSQLSAEETCIGVFKKGMEHYTVCSQTHRNDLRLRNDLSQLSEINHHIHPVVT